MSRIWETHELSPGHRQAVAVVALLEQCKMDLVGFTFYSVGVTYEESGPDPKPIEGPLEWKVVDDVCYGPTCGMEYMVAFKNRSFCELCGCAVASVEKHFSCESHVMQFLSVSFPLEMFRLSHNAPKTRKKNVLDLLSSPKFRFGGGLHKRVNVDWFPPSVEMVVKPECLSFPNLMPELSSLGIDCCCLFCPVCWLTVKVPKNVTDGGEALWNAHCGEHSHFDFAVRRACFGFDEKNFVPMSSTVPKAPKKLHGSWIQMKEDKDVFFVQTQGDVGLEFVVDDQENQEVVCTLCAQWFPRGMDTLINNHIRSYSHLNHYLHVTNRNLLSMLMVQKTEAATRELMLEWLQRSLYNDMDEMRLYSPELANRMRAWGNIAIRKVDATAYDSTHRPIFECVMELVDAVSKDGAEGAQISIKEALAVAAVKVHAMKERSGKVERILCRCTKVTWQWNAKAKTHEFVLSVVGLEDLVERRSSEATGAHPPDFFCRLCAVEIPRRSACLESHVHSAQHVLCYVHKYYPQTIMELDMLPKEGGKEMRRVIAQLLKDHQPKEPYCIPIYDPIGEQERKGIVAMEKIKEEERQRHMAEARKRAQEQRKKKDEERRKQREKELEEEKARMAERARKEKEARERAERLEQEKAHVKKLLQEAQRKAEEERKAKEAKERAKEAKERAEAEAEKQRRQEHLRSLLDREKQRLKALHEKEAQQRRLLEEKEELERKMRDLKDRAAFQRNGPAPVPPPVPDPRNMGPPDPRNMVPPDRRPMGPPDQRTMNPSVGLAKPPPPEPFRQPLLGTGPSNIHNQPVPPPPTVYNNPTGFRITFENAGAKSLFPSFVPIPEAVPVYKGMEEADKATRPMQPNIPVIDRPSLRERRVDPYISNPKIIQSRDQLVDFIWRQGAERIPEKELPVKFNEKAAGIEGALGVDCLYEVICADCSDLDTFYCSMCGFWTTPNDMFKHLETSEHKLAYLFRNYKMYHQTVVSETNSLVRSAMLSQFAIQIWKMEQPPGRVSNRLRSLLDRAIIERVWPEHVNVLDHSWKDEGKTVGRVEVPPPVSKKDLGLVDDEPNRKHKKDKGALKASVNSREEVFVEGQGEPKVDFAREKTPSNSQSREAQREEGLA
ncbi:unnamed protein product [Heligmosomoides polygyrus]|uniref:Uncharacterized protein n=1 Tax=Heligmosomoides polygyrus TaxID=6339 RepID=A0A3P8CAQ2_HELPZ|nr:unnamed protein product [Heligmosomoides polygyrus]